MVNFVLLADGASCNEDVDERRESRPPEVSFQECFGTKVSRVSSGGAVMYGSDDG